MVNSTTPPAGRALWHDRAAQGTLGLAIVLNILLFILVFVAADRLADAVAVSGSSSGSADRFGAPSNALILPIIGLVAWLSAGALGCFYYVARSQRPIAYTIWGAIVLIELATWVPVLALLLNL
ncbi:MAG TPA: hypothetical protein VLE70_11315 [Anaerolineae bacterium]|jgi:hypothetical protein|nr:hypothetical protein [Anaerolineae bacterium]